MVSQGMEHFFPGPSWAGYYQIGSPDLVKFAKALGAWACTISSPDEFRAEFPKAVARARAERKPQVIVAQHDPREVPPYYPRRGGDQ
jgi:thiamine pyrophosphate-dependent acetolactate synthase large subunit-like protein